MSRPHQRHSTTAVTFDVIIPAHNGAATVREAVASALSQTMAPREVVVVADACDDRTAVLARAAGARVLEIAAHSAAAARNAGAAGARGDYLAFLDADDLWKPDWLAAVAHAAAIHPGTALLFGGVEEELPSGRRIRRPACLGAEPYERLLCECFLTTSAVVVRRSAFAQAGGFQPDFAGAGVEDYDLWLRLGTAHPFAAVPGTHVVYRRTQSGAMRTPDIFAGLERDTERVMAAALARRPVPAAVQRRAWANVYRMSAERYLAHGLGRDARRPLGRALRLRPAAASLWALACLSLLPRALGQGLIRARRVLRSTRG